MKNKGLHEVCIVFRSVHAKLAVPGITLAGQGTPTLAGPGITLAGPGMPTLADPKMPMMVGPRIPAPTGPGVAGPEVPTQTLFQPISIFM